MVGDTGHTYLLVEKRCLLSLLRRHISTPIGYRSHLVAHRVGFCVSKTACGQSPMKGRKRYNTLRLSFLKKLMQAIGLGKDRVKVKRVRNSQEIRRINHRKQR